MAFLHHIYDVLRRQPPDACGTRPLLGPAAPRYAESRPAAGVLGFLNAHALFLLPLRFVLSG